MKVLKKIFHYVENIWLGTDGKPSIRRVFAIAIIINFLRNMHYIIFNWEAESSLSDAAMLLGIEAGLIAALLSLTTYSSYLQKNG